MSQRGVSIREATMEWIREYMDAIQSNMIQDLMTYDESDWEEVTKPVKGDEVVLLNKSDQIGTVLEYDEDSEIYKVELENGDVEELREWEDFYLPSSDFPMWSTMWSFRDSADEQWLVYYDGVRKLSECGFTVYESKKYGYFFGIDAAGYNFVDAFWIPLYKARGLKWHDPELEGKDCA